MSRAGGSRRLPSFISEQQLEAFRRQFFPGKPRELFTFLGHTWDVDRARYVLQHVPRTTILVAVAPLAVACGFDRDPERIEEEGDARFLRRDGGGTWINLRWIESDAMRLNQDIPLIFVQTPVFGAPSQLFPIDGLHRLYFAYQKQKAQLAAYSLTLVEERLCRTSQYISQEE